MLVLQCDLDLTLRHLNPDSEVGVFFLIVPSVTVWRQIQRAAVIEWDRICIAEKIVMHGIL
jgi:hypothetical protein